MEPALVGSPKSCKLGRNSDHVLGKKGIVNEESDPPPRRLQYVPGEIREDSDSVAAQALAPFHEILIAAATNPGVDELPLLFGSSLPESNPSEAIHYACRDSADKLMRSE